MIKLDRYTSDFLKNYWDKVKEKLDEKLDEKLQTAIITSSRKYLPNDFYKSKNSLKELILAPYDKLKKAKKYIDEQTFAKMEKECFKPNSDKSMKAKDRLVDEYYEFQKMYEKVANSQVNYTSMRVRIANESGLKVCPYCNRDYINCRADNVSGCQLDHFYSRINYPIFALCLYNLIPVCGTCNRIKNDSNSEFASPFDEDIDWNNDITFSYEPIPNTCGKMRITIKSENQSIKNNIDKMRLEEAYQMHDEELRELQNKKITYSKTQIDEFQEVMQEVMHTVSLQNDELKKAIYGPQITVQQMKRQPLSKMLRDFHKQLGIYD